MRYLKKWNDFLKESVDVSKVIESWKFDKEDIEFMFIDFVDHDWYVCVDLGSIEKEISYSGKEYTSFSEKIYSSFIPAYKVKLSSNKNTQKVDLTNDLICSINTILKKTNGEYYSHFDINKLTMNGNIFSGDIIINNFDFFVSENKTISIPDNYICGLYGWTYSRSDEKGNVWIHVEIDDIESHILDRNSEYRNYLCSNGLEKMWDHYDSYYYEPDTQSLFYKMDNEVSRMTIVALIDELGGLDELITKLDLDTKYFEDMSMDEVVGIIKNEYLNDICRNSELISELKSTVAQWECDAHVYENWEEIISYFDKIVLDCVDGVRIEKEVKRTYTRNNQEGTEKTYHEYMETAIFYEIPFSDQWYLHESEPSNHVLNNIFMEWCDNNLDERMRVHLSDYGDVDKKLLNSELKSIIEQH